MAVTLSVHLLDTVVCKKIEFAQDLSGRSKFIFYHFQDPPE